jgi:hypothetical protein
MTTTLVWTGVALWLGFSAFVVFGPTAGPVPVPARSGGTTRRDRI